MSNHSIEFLTNEQIDKKRWNECIEASVDNKVYAKAFYLDALCPQWSALTNNNYDWVFPITNKKKWTFSYLYQPPFVQQLGLFCKPGSVVPYGEIVSWLKKNFSFWEINWNYRTAIELKDHCVAAKPATNFVLDLSVGYKSIAAKYHNDLIKNLKRSGRSQLQYQKSTNFEKGIALYKTLYKERMQHVKESDYNNFTKACAHASLNNQLVCREAVDENNELVAVALLINDGERLYNLMNTTTEKGRKIAANHFLLNAIIKEHAGKELKLDFEGSDLPGVKAFYENFGAINQPFYAVKYNDLPWPVRLVKSNFFQKIFGHT